MLEGNLLLDDQEGVDVVGLEDDEEEDGVVK